VAVSGAKLTPARLGTTALILILISGRSSLAP
jgi:hypothetical protein